MTTPKLFEATRLAGVDVLQLRGDRLRDAEIADLVTRIVRLAGPGATRPVALDLSRATLVNSTAISVLARLSERCDLHLVGLPPLVLEALDLLGLRPLLCCHATAAEAVAAIGRRRPLAARRRPRRTPHRRLGAPTH